MTKNERVNTMKYEIVEGDLIGQDVDVIVNAWNRNIIPWWLLLPQGVSGAIKKAAGTSPFKELAKARAIPLGEARMTGAGQLAYKAIIHVAGINMLWTASEKSIQDSVINALKLASDSGFDSVAIPIIGAGSGRFSELQALEIIEETISRMNTRDIRDMRVVIVRFKR